MGIIAWNQRRKIIANTGRIADALDGGMAAVNRAAWDRGAAIRQAEYDHVISKRCKRAGMSSAETAEFLALGEEARHMWAAAHPQYQAALRY